MTRHIYFQYARQLINVCKELPDVETAKVPGRVLWDSSLVIFSVQNAGKSKRARLGNQAMLSKDAYRRFLLTIKVRSSDSSHSPCCSVSGASDSSHSLCCSVSGPSDSSHSP